MLKKLLFMIPGAVVGAMLMVTVQSVAAAQSEDHDEMRQASPEQMREHLKARLGNLAERLKIQPSQQAAWSTFAKTVEDSMPSSHPKRPGPDGDAATILHFHANMAALMAKHLSVVAEAADKLQTVLTPDQRKIFADAARHLHGGRHMCGPHDGHEESEAPRD